MQSEEILIQTDTVRVRVMPLLPGKATPWHFHSEVTDTMVCLSGGILVQLKQPEEQHELLPGQRCTVEVNRAHRVSNANPNEPASYMLIQGIGRYDFNQLDYPVKSSAV